MDGPSAKAAEVPGAGGSIADLVAAGGRRDALTLGPHVRTHDELDRWADRVAAVLQAHGVGAGQRVAVIGMNQPWVVAMLLGTWRAQAIPIPLSARLRSHDLAQIMTDARPVAVISAATHGRFPLVPVLDDLVADVPTIDAVWVVDDAVGELREVHRGHATEAADALASDVSLIGYTSGTTGRPKGALITHGAVVRSAGELGDVLALAAGDTTALTVPWNHAFGLACLLAGLVSGGRVALVDSTRTTQALHATIIEREATVVHGSPLLFASLRKGPPLPARTRRGFVAGAVCHPDLLRDLDQAGLRVLNLFGMTELGAVSTTRLDDPADIRHRTVGRPVCGYEARTVSGELQVRGPSMTPGYLGRRDGATPGEGWFRTGDMADIGSSGIITIRGRRDDIVNVAGFNVSPAEVEALLLTHPEVSAAAVLGGPSDTGQALVAFVAPRSPEVQLHARTIVEFARGRLAGYKVPYRVTVMPSLPLLANGKPDLVALRELASPT